MTGARPDVVVLDYGSGNVHSAVKALEAAGAEVELTGDRERALGADGLVVPGVGSFRHVMDELTGIGGERLIDLRLAGGRRVLGICVGMQVLFERGDEGGEPVAGLGQLPGEVRALHAEVLPHMGWNLVDPEPGSTLFAGLEGERFYFVHSYAATTLELHPHPAAEPVHRTWATHGERFLAAIEDGPLSATQFHPEKSGQAGIALLRNWLGSLR